MNIQENVPLASFTTLEVGGPARFFVSINCEDDVAAAFDFARSKSLPAFVLGGGSNIVVSDQGFAGLVVHIGLKGLSINENLVTACAGESWDALVEKCVIRDLAGIECLSGIPGTVGGTPVQNVGAYGQEVSETILFLKCYDRKGGTVVKLSNADCGFGYRTSIFNTSERDRFVVLSVTYELRKGGKPKVAYTDLDEYLVDSEPSLSDVRDAVVAIRRAKSMVIDANDNNRRSAGSFFKNPIVETRKYAEISELSGESPPRFPASDGFVKVPAAWLIERSGFKKGYELGNVGISSNHTLAIINRGGATANEIAELKNKIQRAVQRQFGIALIPEPLFLGEFEAKNESQNV